MTRGRREPQGARSTRRADLAQVPAEPSPAAVLINGTVGVGKTTAAEALGDWLRIRGVPNAVIDVDGLRRIWPAPADDPFQTAVTLANLSSVARTYREYGAHRLVVAGVVETRAERAAYEEAVGAPMVVCRLTLPLPTVRARLEVRHAPDEQDRAWHLARCGELDAVLDAADLDDHTLDTTGQSPSEVAVAIARLVGWVPSERA